jgi:RHS repeat-associated protein
VPSLRAPARRPLPRLAARVLILALVAGLLPADADASLPPPNSIASPAARDLPPGALASATETLVSVVVVAADPIWLTKSAFGELLAHTGSDPQPYAFAGEPLDPNSGWQYHRARWMDPRTGIFTSSDPFSGTGADPQSLHKYTYAHLNPVSNSDPTGRITAIEGISVANIVSGLRVASLGFAVGAVLGAGDAYLQGGDQDEILVEAAYSGLIGAVGGAIGLINLARPVLLVTGQIFGAVGVAEALSQDNLGLSAYRGAFFLSGAFAFFRAAPPVPKPLSGGLGKDSTRDQIRLIVMLLEERGWNVIAGGGRFKEEYLPPLGGKGRRGSNFVDISLEKNGRVLRINTVTMQGVAPHPRELAAAALIRQKRPHDHLLLIPKRD